MKNGTDSKKCELCNMENGADSKKCELCNIRNRARAGNLPKNVRFVINRSGNSLKNRVFMAKTVLKEVVCLLQTSHFLEVAGLFL